MNTRLLLYRRFLISLFALLFIITQGPLTGQVLRTERLQQMIGEAEKKWRGRIGLSIQRLKDDSVVCRTRYTELFIPASVVKVLTTGAVLQTKGSSYRIPTDVYMTGQVKGQVLDGNLIIRGHGDPSIASKYIAREEQRFLDELVEVLKRKGIKEITGGIYIDGSLPTGVGPVASWLSADTRNVYGAGLYGINYRDNVLDFSVVVHAQRGALSVPETIPQLSGLTYLTEVTKARRRGISYSSTPASPVLRIRANTRYNQRARYRIPNPAPADALYANLLQRLGTVGIGLGHPGGVTYDGYEPEGILLYTYHSRTLDTLAKITNYRSQNLFAEAIAAQLKPNIDRGQALTSYWRERLRINPRELQLYDGSGLSRHSRVSPQAFALALRDLWQTNLDSANMILETLPEVGVEGTVRRLMKSREHFKMFLKSGTMSGISTYVGYAYDGHDWYSIVYLTNGMAGAWAARSVLQSIVGEVWSFEENTVSLLEPVSTD